MQRWLYADRQVATPMPTHQQASGSVARHGVQSVFGRGPRTQNIAEPVVRVRVGPWPTPSSQKTFGASRMGVDRGGSVQHDY